MISKPHYSKAPITEAIIDLRVRLSEQMNVSALEHVQAGQEKIYPNKKNFMVATGQIQLGMPPVATADSKQTGFLFTSVDEKWIFQARLDGFTLSRLAPYESWEPFQKEARRLWDIYRGVTRPEQVVRLAVRYINRLDLPLPLNDFKDYLRTVPEISPGLPQGLSGFFMQVSIPQDDIKSLLLLNETIVESARMDVASVVLDIDLFRAVDLPTAEDEIWAFFERLHDRKNEIFEACITDKTRRLIE